MQQLQRRWEAAQRVVPRGRYAVSEEVLLHRRLFLDGGRRIVSAARAAPPWSRELTLAATQHLDDAEDAELVAAIGARVDAAMVVIMRRHREPVVAFRAPARG